MRLAECAGKRVLVLVMGLINERFDKCRAADLRNEEWLHFSVESHTRIIDALERKEPGDSRAAVEAHLATVSSKHLLAQVKD